MKKYDKYKPSGIEWIGEIPEHWSKTKLKYEFYIKARVGWKGLTSDEFKQKAYAYLVTGTDFKKRNIDWNTCYQVEKERYEDDPFIQLEEGDLLITKDGTIGKVSFAIGLDKPACLNSGIFVLRPTGDIDNRFFYWVLCSNVFGDFNRLTATGSTIQHLYQNVFVEFEFGYPEITKQQAIANYLDQKCAAIDNLIEQKQKLISLYEENRQSMINQAVTRGLNSNVKMKDSGVEWIGEIPEHWEVKPLKTLLERIIGGGTPSTENDMFWGGTIPWVSAKDMKVDNIETSVDSITELAIRNSTTNLIPSKSILVVVRSGILKHSFPVAINDIDVCINQDLKALLPNGLINNEFMFWKLKGESHNILTRCKKMGATVDSLEMSELLNYPIVYPSIDEQFSIIKTIENKTKYIDNIIRSLGVQITLYQEYKQSLIFNSVTGKIMTSGVIK